MDNVTNIERLRWRCYQIIPLVFDEALSYYEVLCKGAKKTNELIDFVNEMAETVQSNTEDIEELKTTVEDITDKTNYTIFEGEMRYGSISIAPTGTEHSITDYNIVKVWTDHSASDGGILCSVSAMPNGNYTIRGVGIGTLFDGDMTIHLVGVYINYNPTTGLFIRNNSYKPDDADDTMSSDHIQAGITKIVGVY